LKNRKKSFWKFALAGLCFLGPLLAWLGFGDRGLIHLYRKEMERQAYVEKIRQLAEENQAMIEEIHRLRTDMKYVESVARKELNLIKKNEIVYRFNKENTSNNTIKVMRPKSQSTNKNGGSEREEGNDDKIE
jgi:cell division protein FtsB